VKNRKVNRKKKRHNKRKKNTRRRDILWGFGLEETAGEFDTGKREKLDGGAGLVGPGTPGANEKEKKGGLITTGMKNQGRKRNLAKQQGRLLMVSQNSP